MDPLLEVKHLVKRFRKLTAVNDVSFSIPSGTCFGLLGPNGAGKTTLIEMIEDIIPPTAGEVFFRGKTRTETFSETIGIQFQQTSLLSFLTVGETIKNFSKYYNKTLDFNELVEWCRLEPILDRMNDKISGGQKQRLLITLALLNDPELLFLDEPSTGLDPQSRRDLWRIIQSIRDKGKTIIITTHYMDEAQFLCNEIAVMDMGKIIEFGSPETLIKKHFQGTTVTLPISAVAVPPEQLEFEHRIVGKTIEIHTLDVEACLEKLIRIGCDLTDLSVRSPNLEDVFLKLTGRKLHSNDQNEIQNH